MPYYTAHFFDILSHQESLHATKKKCAMGDKWGHDFRIILKYGVDKGELYDVS